MAVSVTPQMITAGWAEISQLEPMASSFMDESEAAPILTKVYQAMHAAGPESSLAHPAQDAKPDSGKGGN